jgi:hypothetical protein
MRQSDKLPLAERQLSPSDPNSSCKLYESVLDALGDATRRAIVQ